MAQYQYRAVDPRGRSVQGNLEAANVADLEMRLSRMGLDMVRYREQVRAVPRVGARSVKRRDLITFCLHLEQLTTAGVPIVEGLGDLRDSLEHPRFREIIGSMVEAIEGGSTLSDSMAAYPRVFDKVMVSLVRAGEQTGQLSEVFRNLTDSLKWQDEQMALLKKLITYPALVGTVVIGVIFFLMTYLVPQLLSFVTAMGKDVPVHTKVLMAVSKFFADYWYVILAVPVLLFATLSYLARTSPSVRLKLDDLKLRIWVVGPLMKKSILARFANYFALMYGAGVTVLDAIRISEEIVGNRALADALARAGRQIADGSALSTAFESTAVFPPLVLRMLRVGEGTGALEVALHNVSYFYSREVREGVERLQSLIEPTMTVVLGAILAWVMFSVLGPIYDLISQIKI